jgi:hypothetical protein
MVDFLKQLEDLERSTIEMMREETLQWYLQQLRNLAMGQKADDKEKLASVLEAITGKAAAPPSSDKVQEAVKPYVLNVIGTPNPLLAGSMILFRYDPKHKLTLPYYDTYPLVFPINFESDSFLGLNMHYLPPIERAKLFNALLSLINNPKIDEKSRLNISYQILKGASRFRGYKPCLKRYLFGHLRSTVMRINPIQWHKVLFLPIANFVKASQQKVWQDSIDMIKRKP